MGWRGYGARIGSNADFIQNFTRLRLSEVNVSLCGTASEKAMNALKRGSHKSIDQGTRNRVKQARTSVLDSELLDGLEQ